MSIHFTLLLSKATPKILAELPQSQAPANNDYVYEMRHIALKEKKWNAPDCASARR